MMKLRTFCSGTSEISKHAFVDCEHRIWSLLAEKKRGKPSCVIHNSELPFTFPLSFPRLAQAMGNGTAF